MHTKTAIRIRERMRTHEHPESKEACNTMTHKENKARDQKATTYAIRQRGGDILFMLFTASHPFHPFLGIGLDGV